VLPAIADQLTTLSANRLTFACSCLSAGACASGGSCNATNLSQWSCWAGECHPHSRHKQQQARGQAAFGPSYTLEHCTHASCCCICGCKEERAAGAHLVSPDALTRYHLDTHAMQIAQKAYTQLNTPLSTQRQDFVHLHTASTGCNLRHISPCTKVPLPVRGGKMKFDLMLAS